MRVPFLLSLLLTLFLVTPVHADLEEALTHVETADQALKKKQYSVAAALYRQALDAHASCIPALCGLGEALLGDNNPSEAIVALRTVLRQTKPGMPVPDAWQAYAKKARKLLAKHDEHGQALERLIDSHVGALVKLASKYLTKDPDLADRALGRALLLRPNHKRANDLRARLASQGARRLAIFDGKQIADWDGGRGQWWKVVDGVIVGDTKGVASFIRNQTIVEGDFDVVLEARITKVHDESPFVALMAAWRAEHDHSRFGVLCDAVTWDEHKGKDERVQVFREEASRLKRPFDPSTWTVYELRFRGDRIHAFVNGRQVSEIPRPKNRSGGYVGILSQGCRAEIKRLDVLYR